MVSHNMLNLFRCFFFVLAASCGYANADQAFEPTSFYSNFSNTRFVDQYNKTFQPNHLMGKVALFNFVYTKCSNICPTQTKQLAEMYKGLPNAYQEKIVLVTVSLDSQYDKPSILKSYAKRMKAEFKNWQFLSGSYDDIKLLQERLFLFGNPKNPSHPKVDVALLKTKQKEEVLKNHMTILWAVDKKGMLIQRYSASPMDTQRVSAELKQLADF